MDYVKVNENNDIEIEIKVKILSKYDPCLMKVKVNDNTTGNDLINHIYKNKRTFINYMFGKSLVFEHMLIYDGEIMNSNHKLTYYMDINEKINKTTPRKYIEFTNDNIYYKKVEKTYEMVDIPDAEEMDEPTKQ